MSADPQTLNVVALAGGVGGAKLAQGLAAVLPAKNLTVVVNIGDDFEHYGLRICPDLDTVCYTLAGMANPVTGWGISNESWAALEATTVLGGPSWFRLGDRDLGTHLERTRRMRLGQPLSRITTDFCLAWGIQPHVLPVTDYFVPTLVHTEIGDLAFQEYFVQYKFEPVVKGFTFKNAQDSAPAPGVLDAIEAANVIVFCPSNPFVSIDPILAIPGIKKAILARRKAGAAIIAVTPIIGGNAVKGPAAKMFLELGIQPSARAVAEHYRGIINGFLLDRIDEEQAAAIQKYGFLTRTTNTLMPDTEERSRLALECLHFCMDLLLSTGVA